MLTFVLNLGAYKSIIFFFGLSLSAFAQSQHCCLENGGVNFCDRQKGIYVCADSSYSDCRCDKFNPFLNDQKKIPKNSKINKQGDGWVCLEGFYQKKQSCLKVDLPRNAEYTANLAGWQCKKGYIQRKFSCAKVHVPKHAKLTKDGRTFRCLYGYQKYRSKCRKIKVPKHAALNKEGSDWECKDGYQRFHRQCKKQCPPGESRNFFGFCF